jgi:hypothetical protein
LKKVFVFLILALTLVSCHKDDKQDFDFDAVYFPYTIDVRAVVVGEGMKVKIGASLGGVMENTKDRNINFVLDNTLVTPALLTLMKVSSSNYIKSAVSSLVTLSPLPASYYTLSNSGTIVIKAGQHSGAVTLTIDSVAFLTDPATINPQYVLPLYITKADADSILEPYRAARVGIKYENMLFGKYLHGGVTTVKDATGMLIQTIAYKTENNQKGSKIWTLTTVAPDAVVSNGYSDQTITVKKEIMLTLNGPDVTVSSAPGSTNTYLTNGASTFNRATLLQDRKILLNYKYFTGTKTYYCQDTLTFINRIWDEGIQF